MSLRSTPAPGTRAAQAIVPAVVLLLLASCGTAPKKDVPPPQATATRPEARPAGPRRVSPYAPAQEDPSKRGHYTAGGLYAPHIRDSAPDELPQVDLIPEPEVRDEPRARYGNRSPYQVLGKSYTVLDDTEGFVERGLASYYGKKFHGRRTSSLEVYDMYTFSAAHKTLPLPSYARVTNLRNGESVVVRVNDRGPFHEGRVIDLSYAAAVKLGIHRSGTAPVEVRALSPGDVRHAGASPTREAVATGAPPSRPLPAAGPVMPASGTASSLDALVAGLPPEPVVTSTTLPTPPAGTGPAVATPGSTPTRDWRFDMRQDGRTMTADEFDAWMRTRGARVATGVPGKPAQSSAGAPAPATVGSVASASPPAIAAAVLPPSSGPASPPASIHPMTTVATGRPAALAVPPSSPGPGVGGVMLQVASFAARANAERALAMVQGAGIGGARLHDAVANGQPVWRLRVGPVAGGDVSGLAARIAGLGFGAPRVVHD